MSTAFALTSARLGRTFLAVATFACCVYAFAYHSAAHAVPFTYSYAGNPFDQFRGMSYSDTDSVSGTFTIDAATNIGLSFADYTPLVTAFSFTDGVQTLTETSSLFAYAIQFGTDGQGDITNWIVQFIVLPGMMVPEPEQGIVTANRPSSVPVPFVLDLGSLQSTDGGAVAFNPGRWTQAVPEPSTVLLLMLGIAVVMTGARRSSSSVSQARLRLSPTIRRTTKTFRS